MENLLPPVAGLATLNASDALNSDIIKAIHNAFPQAVKQVKKLAPLFKRASAEQSARAVWDFLKQKITYKKDSFLSQLIKMPNVFINTATGDCKSYSLFAASIMAANGYKVKFRYAGYDASGIPTHVYVIAENIIIDGVYSQFNAEKTPVHFKDYTMDVYTLSGISAFDTANIGYAGQLQKLFDAYPKKDSVVSSLLAKELSRVTGTPIKTVYATHHDLKQYAAALNRVITRSNRKNGIVYALAVKELDAINNGSHDGVIYGIGSFKSFIKKVGSGIKSGLKKVGGAVKTVALAPARGAFLGIVAINVKGIATNMAASNQTDLKNAWEKLGGNFNELSKVINTGKQKKQLLGWEEDINGIGEPVTVASALALAAPILAALAKFLSGKDKVDTKEEAGDLAYQEAIANGVSPREAAFLRAKAMAEYTPENKSWLGRTIDTINTVSDGLTNAIPNLANDIESGKVVVSDKQTGFQLSTPVLVGGVALIGVAMLAGKRRK